MQAVIQRLVGEELKRAEAAKHAPPRAIRGKDEVLVVISDVLGARVGRPAAEVSIVGSEELLGRGGRGGDYDRNGAETEAEKGAVGLGEGVEGLVRLGAEVRQVAEHRPALRARRERQTEMGAVAPSAAEEDGGECESAEEEQEGEEKEESHWIGERGNGFKKN